LFEKITIYYAKQIFGGINMERRGGVAAGLSGGFWFAGWLFTISFANLVWWKIILGIVVWPYFLGIAVR
jgi:hypothetical protein